MSKKRSLLLIIASGILSVLCSMAFVSYGAAELASLIYFIVPVFIAILTIILFLIVDFFLQKGRKWLTYSIIAFNILVGIFMRFDFYFNIIHW